MTKTPPESAQELRQCAEEKYRRDGAVTSKPLSPEETEQPLHELRVHLIELEMQNEELRHSQGELESLRSSYFDLYDLAPVGYLTVSDEGLILKTNLAAATMLGVARNYPFHKPMTQFIFPEDQDLYFQRRKQLIDSGELQNWEMRLKRVDGSYFWAELQSIVAHNGENWITINDVTKRKKAEEALIESEYRWKFALEGSGDGAWDWNIQTGEAFYSRRYKEMLGFSEDEIGNSSDEWLKRIHPEDAPGVMTTLGSYLDGKTGSARVEFRMLCKDGSWKWVLGRGTVVSRDSDGKPLRMIGTNTDLTVRNKAEEEKHTLEQQLQHTQKLESLGVLSGGIAHDFNNILAIIVGYCALTKMDYETAEKHIPIIETAAERAAALCRQMLAYAGKAQLTKSKVNMVTKVDDIVTMLKATLPQNAVIKTDLSAEIPVIEGDASQLRQVVMNLIINASEAIGTEQGEVSVSLARIKVIAGTSYEDYHGKAIPPGDYVCLEVTDNGCGMDEITKWRIFEPFYTTKFTGRGLGMSAVLGIIKSHGGALQLFSQLGQGSTFKVYLPVSTSGITVGEDQKASAPSAPWQGSGTILLVEDEDEVRHIAKALLKNFGFTVLEAVNGKEALEMYQKNGADITLVVTDMGMPVMDGYEMFHKLKSLNSELPIIISSGYGDAEVSSRIGSDNIAGLISKPYNPDKLRDVVKRVVGDASPEKA